MNILQKMKREIIVFDGAMGSLLQQSGIEIPKIPEELNITNPQDIIKIHMNYLENGSDIVLTNTFGLNPFKVKDSEYTLKELAMAAISNAHKAALSVTKQAMVAFDIGPLGTLLEPNGTLSFEEAYRAYQEIVLAVTHNEDFDVFVIETQSDLLEVRAAVLAVKENSTKPVFVTMTFDNDQTTLLGNDVDSIVTTLEALKVDAIGMNCSFGPKQMLPIIERFVKYSSTPIMVQPNAGMPKVGCETLEYDIDAKEFARYCSDILDLGVTIIGGCCGTTYSHIRELKQVVNTKLFSSIKPKHFHKVCSGFKTVDLDQGFTKIGERINPTGRKDLREQIVAGDYSKVIKEAILQEEEGADLIDINMGIPKQDESKLLYEQVKLLQGYVKVPLQLDSANPSSLERALRVCNGKPILNSVNGKEESMKVIFPLMKKYGAMAIGLLIDENGLAYTAEEKVKIAQKIVCNAQKHGISADQFIIDPLTLTASAQQKDVIETVKVLPQIKELGVKTIMGISNVSFGLPNREALNSSFISMAIYNGLDSAIVNPGSKEVMQAIYSSLVLTNRDIDSKLYIEKYNNYTKEQVISENNIDLKQAIIKGMSAEAKIQSKILLETKEPLDIIENIIVPSLNEVGQLFEQQKLYLPQLIQSAQSVSEAFEVIKKQIKGDDDGSEKGKIILATVKGDVHDIGKNIAKVLLENYGYIVYDLGKDVSYEDIASKIDESDAKVVGLSALMTTTVESMEHIIHDIKENYPDVKVIVGGAVLTEEYAHNIHADYYAKDALEGVEILKKIYQP